MDVTAIGEILIDLTQTGVNGAGVPQFSANPGGARFGSTFLLEGRPAGAAVDGDPPLSPGHPHHLPAVGALEVAVLLVVGPGAEGGPLPPQGADGLEKAAVLRPAPLQVPGQGAEQADGQHHRAQHLEGQQAGEQEHDVEQAVQQDQEQVELISSIASRHKAGQTAADHGRSPPGETEIRNIPMIARQFGRVNGVSVNKM